MERNTISTYGEELFRHIIKIHEEGKEYACYTEALQEFDKLGIPMYVLSNSGFSAEALSIAIERLDG